MHYEYDYSPNLNINTVQHIFMILQVIGSTKVKLVGDFAYHYKVGLSCFTSGGLVIVVTMYFSSFFSLHTGHM